MTAQLDVFRDRPDPGREQPGRVHRDGGDTEKAAATLRQPQKGSQRMQVLRALQLLGPDGATDYELWMFGIGARPHVPGTRREELIRDGWPIKDSGKRRLTDTGSPAIVWVLEEEKT